MMTFKQAVQEAMDGKVVKRAHWTKAPLRYEDGFFYRGKNKVDLNVIQHDADWEIVPGQYTVVHNGNTSAPFSSKASAEAAKAAILSAFPSHSVAVRYNNSY